MLTPIRFRLRSPRSSDSIVEPKLDSFVLARVTSMQLEPGWCMQYSITWAITFGSVRT
jgi:hypothetical protein